FAAAHRRGPAGSRFLAARGPLTGDPVADEVDRAFDFLCQRKLGELFDPERALAVLDAVATEDSVARLLRRLWAPARARLLAQARASERTLGDWLPEGARRALLDLVAQPTPLPRELLRKLVGSPEVRAEVRAMLEQAVPAMIEQTLAALPFPVPGLR